MAGTRVTTAAAFERVRKRQRHSRELERATGKDRLALGAANATRRQMGYGNPHQWANVSNIFRCARGDRCDGREPLWQCQRSSSCCKDRGRIGEVGALAEKREQAPRTPNASRSTEGWNSRSVWSAPGLPALSALRVHFSFCTFSHWPVLPDFSTASQTY